MANFELAWLSWLGSHSRDAPPDQGGIGDDMAILPGTDGPILMSSDMLVDGVHFDVGHHTPEQIGRKAAACCLSDCAAMAVQPVALTLSLAVPSDWAVEECQALFIGAQNTAARYGARVVGGDTVRWRQSLAIDVAILARPFHGIEPVLRSNAQVGDRLYVTGPLGGSLMGQHLMFTPRVAEARRLAESLGTDLHALIDISDGLSLDLWRVCRASGVGAVLMEERVRAVASEAAHQSAAQSGKSALDHALSDGEDFELLFAASTDPTETGVQVFEIGCIVDKGLYLQDTSGHRKEIAARGFLH